MMTCVYLGLLFLGNAQATPAQLPSLLKEIEKTYSQAKTVSAQFIQVNETAHLGSKQTTQGTILLKRPSKIRWETKTPEPNLLVSNGEHYWFYTPPFDAEEKGQVIETKASKIQTKLATELLAGSFSAQKIKISQESPNRFSFNPKSGTAGTVLKVTFEVNSKEKRVSQVLLEHQGGNKTQITLNQIQLGTPLKDELFSFKAPPHTERIFE